MSIKNICSALLKNAEVTFVQIMPGAETFLLQGDNGKAVLLLHGYTGTAAEMRPLGDYLHAQGYTVLCPRLPGHGTTVEDLERTTASQWVATAQDAGRQLLAAYENVYVAGLSMGGLLAIKVAATLPVKKAAILSAPIYVRDKRTPFLPILRFFIRYLPKRKRDYQELAQYCQAYDRMPTRPLPSLFALVGECKKKLLAQVKIPALVLQSTVEHTVQPRSARYIYEHLGTPLAQKKLLWFERSGHILTLDCEHAEVFAAIGEFFAE